MCGEQLSHFYGCGELWEGDKVGSFGKPVDYCQNSGVTCGGWQPSDEIERDVGPRSARLGKRLK